MCNTQTCNVDCRLGDWGAWSTCSEPCGPGQRTRTRQPTTWPTGAGLPCGSLLDQGTCNVGTCPSSCVLSEWKESVPCSKECGGGWASFTRVVSGPAECGTSGIAETRPCNVQPCTRECLLSQWSDWSSCSQPCGDGTQTRYRDVLSAGVGKSCDVALDSRPCKIKECSVLCSTSTWEPKGSCSVSCGGGKQSWHLVIPPNIPVGVCEASEELRDCNTNPCGSQCQYSDWTPWSECDVTCGAGGLQTRERTLLARPTASSCTDPLFETKNCTTVPAVCDGNCLYTDFIPVGVCSAPCEKGKQNWERQLISGDPVKCIQTRVRRGCAPTPCGPTECQVSQWSDWSACSALCGPGERARSRNVEFQPPAVAMCPDELVQQSPCDAGSCTVNCTFGMWGEWLPTSCNCPTTLVQRRTRSVVAGKCTDPTDDARSCNCTTDINVPPELKGDANEPGECRCPPGEICACNTPFAPPIPAMLPAAHGNYTVDGVAQWQWRKLSGAGIALIVIGTLLAVGCLAGIIFLAMRRRQKDSVRTQSSYLDWRRAAKGGRDGQGGAYRGLEAGLKDGDDDDL